MTDTSVQSRLRCAHTVLFLLLLIVGFIPTRAAAFLSPANFKARPTSCTSSRSSDLFDNNVLSENQIGIVCQGGSDPNRPQKVNQDAYFHQNITLDNGKSSNQYSYMCIGVLDGHGLKGHIVSAYLSQQLPRLFQYHMNHLLRGDGDSSESDDDDSILADLKVFEETLDRLGGLDAAPEKNGAGDKQPPHTSVIHQAMINSFHSTHYAAMQNPEVPAGRNGATCVMVVLDYTEDTLHIAHVGDSRVIQVDIVENKDTTVSVLSTETTVKIEDERQRIERGEGSIRGTNVFYGPIGIAMTRSLGNAAILRAGVVPTPIVDTYPLSSSDTTTTKPSSFLVLGTDGIWDVLSNDAVADIIVTSIDDTSSEDVVQIACDRIASKARNKWIGDLPIIDEEKIDDITCMVVRIA